MHSLEYPVRKPDAVELLAHLTGLKSVQFGFESRTSHSLVIPRADERNLLGLEFLDWCRYSKGEHRLEARSNVHALAVGLTGLANLARGEKGGS